MSENCSSRWLPHSETYWGSSNWVLPMLLRSESLLWLMYDRYDTTSKSVVPYLSCRFSKILRMVVPWLFTFCFLVDLLGGCVRSEKKPMWLIITHVDVLHRHEILTEQLRIRLWVVATLSIADVLKSSIVCFFLSATL